MHLPSTVALLFIVAHATLVVKAKSFPKPMYPVDDNPCIPHTHITNDDEPLYPWTSSTNKLLMCAKDLTAAGVERRKGNVPPSDASTCAHLLNAMISLGESVDVQSSGVAKGPARTILIAQKQTLLEASKQLEPYCLFLSKEAPFPKTPINRFTPKGFLKMRRAKKMLKLNTIQNLLTTVIPKHWDDLIEMFTEQEKADKTIIAPLLENLRVFILIRAATSALYVSQYVPVSPHPSKSDEEIQTYSVKFKVIDHSRAYGILFQALKAINDLVEDSNSRRNYGVPTPKTNFDDYRNKAGFIHTMRATLTAMGMGYAFRRADKKHQVASWTIKSIGNSWAMNGRRIAVGHLSGISIRAQGEMKSSLEVLAIPLMFAIAFGGKATWQEKLLS